MMVFGFLSEMSVVLITEECVVMLRGNVVVLVVVMIVHVVVLVAVGVISVGIEFLGMESVGIRFLGIFVKCMCRLRVSRLLLERGGVLTGSRLRVCMLERTGGGKGQGGVRQGGVLLGRGLAEFEVLLFDG